MTGITAVQLVTPLYAPTAGLSDGAPQAEAGTLSSPSTRGSLGNGQASAADAYAGNTYAANGTLTSQVRYVLEKQGSDRLGMALLSSIRSSSVAARFQGIGAALLEQLASSGGREISQSAVRLSGTEQPDAIALQLQQASLRASAPNTVAFSLVTASGATVSLSLASGEQGLAVSAQVSGGTLSDDELQGLAALADGFQTALDGLTQVPPRIQLQAMLGLDSTLFTSLQLSASLDIDGEARSFDLRLDGALRSMALEGASGRVQLDLDASEALLGGTAQRQASLGNYLDQFDAAQRRGQGDAHLLKVFKDAFTQLNALDNDTGTRTTLAKTPERALLSGLADFTGSISQAEQQNNPVRLQETTRFQYNVSQSTSIKPGGNWNGSVQQDQQTQLKAAFHKGLNPLVDLQLGTDRESQDYSYHEIDDRSSSSTRLGYEKGRLVEASAMRQASQNERVRTYLQGTLTDDVSTPVSATRTQSLVTALEDLFRQERMVHKKNGVSILDNALLSVRSRWQLESQYSAI